MRRRSDAVEGVAHADGERWQRCVRMRVRWSRGACDALRRLQTAASRRYAAGMEWWRDGRIGVKNVGG